MNENMIYVLLTAIFCLILGSFFGPIFIAIHNKPEQVEESAHILTAPLQIELDQCQDLQYSYLAALTATSQLLEIYKQHCVEYCKSASFDGKLCEKQCKGELVR